MQLGQTLRVTRAGQHAGPILLICALAMVGCAAPSMPSAQSGTTASPGSAPTRTLVMAINTEVGNLSPKAEGPTNPDRTTRLFNAQLTILDAQGHVRPYLAEALPQLNTDSWQVFPDGRMETTWKLRPNLTWQDGPPLTAEDFVFAFQVYRAPELAGLFTPKPQDVIERVVAVDPQTIRIHWRSPILHQGERLPPLPRHILAEPFAAFEQDRSGRSDTFQSLRYWTTEYVGAGPYRLTSWVPASNFEGAAFDGHALGRPKIDRIVVRIIDDNNAVLANVMAGEVHLALAQALRFEQAMILRQQAGFNDVDRKGIIILSPQSINGMVFQHRPEYQQTPGLLDLRVRKAIVHTIDRESISERLYEGQSPTPISYVYPTDPFYAEVDRAVTKYPYDPRVAEQLMTAAGFSRGPDGFFVDSRGQRFPPAVWNTADLQHNTVAAIVLDGLRRAGIDAQQTVMPAALERDNEYRSTFPGIIIHSGLGVNSLASAQIAGPANRWSGGNRGGWSNPDFDLHWDRYYSTLDLTERHQAYVQMMKIHSEQVPNYPFHFNLQVVAHVAAVKGPQQEIRSWNIHDWEWQ